MTIFRYLSLVQSITIIYVYLYFYACTLSVCNPSMCVIHKLATSKSIFCTSRASCSCSVICLFCKPREYPADLLFLCARFFILIGLTHCTSYKSVVVDEIKKNYKRCTSLISAPRALTIEVFSTALRTLRVLADFWAATIALAYA